MDKTVPYDKKQLTKPLGQRSYGSIPHLPGSRTGPSDITITEGQAKIATEKVRDKHDVVIVQEKLDGSNCAVAKINGQLIALTRNGYLAKDSTYNLHRVFAAWADYNSDRFNNLLNEGERVCGEWLAQAVGTKYNLLHEPFVPFDILVGSQRLSFFDIGPRLLNQGFKMPQTIHIGDSFSISKALEATEQSAHGAQDLVEGAVWRVERKGKVDFLTKFVRQEKVDGKLMDQNIWNIDIEPYKHIMI